MINQDVRELYKFADKTCRERGLDISVEANIEAIHKIILEAYTCGCCSGHPDVNGVVDFGRDYVEKGLTKRTRREKTK